MCAGGFRDRHRGCYRHSVLLICKINQKRRNSRRHDAKKQGNRIKKKRGVDNTEAVGRKHNVERGNRPAQSFGDNEPRGRDFKRVGIRVAANSIKRAFTGESRFDPVLGEVEKEREPFDKGRFALDRGDDVGDM